MDIAKRIIELRESKGYSTNKLATICGLSQGFVRQIELGEKQPTVDSLNKICTGLEISLGEFFTEENNELTPELRHLLTTAARLSPEQQQLLQKFLETIISDTKG